MKGGKRKGAGNKLGSVRPKITDFWTQEDIAEYFGWVKENYKKSDRLATWVGDHLLGKPVQPIGNDQTGELKITFDASLRPSKENS